MEEATPPPRLHVIRKLASWAGAPCIQLPHWMTRSSALSVSSVRKRPSQLLSLSQRSIFAAGLEDRAQERLPSTQRESDSTEPSTLIHMEFRELTVAPRRTN